MLHDTRNDDPDALCGACGGNFEQHHDPQRGTTYGIVTCRWCVRGRQTPVQQALWLKRQRALELKSSGIRRPERPAAVQSKDPDATIRPPPPSTSSFAASFAGLRQVRRG